VSLWTQASKPDLADILEDAWDAQLFRGPKALANVLGWTTYHTLRSRGSRSGYPDRTCVRERILFAELKREKTKPTADQIAWLDKLSAAGGEVYLWRPSDLEEIGLVLGRRRTFHPGNEEGGGLLPHGHGYYEPDSMWIAGRGRRDSPSPQTSQPLVQMSVNR
jgi:hypothetical protein